MSWPRGAGRSTSERAIRRRPMQWSWKLAEVSGIGVCSRDFSASGGLVRGRVLVRGGKRRARGFGRRALPAAVRLCAPARTRSCADGSRVWVGYTRDWRCSRSAGLPVSNGCPTTRFRASGSHSPARPSTSLSQWPVIHGDGARAARKPARIPRDAGRPCDGHVHTPRHATWSCRGRSAIACRGCDGT